VYPFISRSLLPQPSRSAKEAEDQDHVELSSEEDGNEEEEEEEWEKADSDDEAPRRSARFSPTSRLPTNATPPSCVFWVHILSRSLASCLHPGNLTCILFPRAEAAVRA
jgi:hypothetical protein